MATDHFVLSYIIAQIERFCLLYNICGVKISEDLFPVDIAATGASSFAPSSTSFAVANTLPIADLSKQQEEQASAGFKVRIPKDTRTALELERKNSAQREQKRIARESKELKAREREAREATREERRRKKLEIREQRERFIKEQKEAAMKRAAELVLSNRVPLEITRGAAAAKTGRSTDIEESIAICWSAHFIL